MPTAAGFGNSFTELVGNAVVFDGDLAYSVAPGGNIDSQVPIYNPGPLGALRRLTVMVQGQGQGGATTINVRWVGGVQSGVYTAAYHDFWQGIPLSNGMLSSAVAALFLEGWGPYATAGTIYQSPYVFTLPYLGFSITNTGANTAESLIIVAIGEY